MLEEENVNEQIAEPYQDDIEEDIGQDWRVKDLVDADWALRRLGELEKEVADNKRIEAADILRVKARTAKLNATAARGVAFFESHLRAYADAHRAELLGSGKKKSRSLQHGSIGWRKTGGKLKVVDAEALLDWARGQPVEENLVRTKEEPAIDEIKRFMKNTGELPPGAELEPEGEEIHLKPQVGGDNVGAN